MLLRRVVVPRRRRTHYVVGRAAECDGGLQVVRMMRHEYECPDWAFRRAGAVALDYGPLSCREAAAVVARIETAQ